MLHFDQSDMFMHHEYFSINNMIYFNLFILKQFGNCTLVSTVF